MKPDVDLRSVALEALQVRITKVLPMQIRRCLEELETDQIWWRPNAQSNSIGNLVLHVRGAVLHFLCRGLGGLEFERDRPAEFNSERELSKEELLELVDDMVAKANSTFEQIGPNQLDDPSSVPDYYSTVLEDILGVAIHLATHTGQIVYVTKMLQQGSLNELWSTAHRAAAAWRT